MVEYRQEIHRVKVHAVVVNWNGGAANVACLSSLRANGLRAQHIHFIDNGSTDGSVALAEATAPGLLIEQTGSNLGFAAAANRGLRAAWQAGADAVLLMNNDAVAAQDCVAALVQVARKDPQYGLYGPRIYADRAADRLWCCGVRLGAGPNLGTLRGHGARGRGRFERDQTVDALTGCGLLLLRAVADAVGELDESYFVYVEDADYCARARKAGFQPRYVAKAVMEHAGAGSTGGGYGAARKYLTAHGTVLYLKRHGTAAQWLCWLLFDVLAWPLVFLAAVPRGRAGGAWGKLCGTLAAVFGRPARRPLVQQRA